MPFPVQWPPWNPAIRSRSRSTTALRRALAWPRISRPRGAFLSIRKESFAAIPSLIADVAVARLWSSANPADSFD
jgi:hypothetical protein